MTAQDRIRQVIEDRHSYARQWKAATGGKVLGYFCSYFPEEIVYAAGVLPIRILGGHEPQDVTEPYIFSMYCPYARDCLAQGLLGKYAYVDGIASAYTCGHIHQAFSSWRKHIPVEMSHCLWVPPQVADEAALHCYREEVLSLKRKVEDWVGRGIGDEELDRAIGTYNLNRRLLAQLYALRRANPPGIGGADAMELALASQLMDKGEHNRLLEQLLKEPAQRANGGPRLMLMGSICDHLEAVRLIEALGANVVVDDFCTGGRYFWQEVSRDGDQIEALVERYLSRPPCPIQDLQGEARRGHVMKLVEEYQVRGVIVLRQKFCESHAYDQALLAPWFRERGIPTLSLELDFTIPLGQYRTRVEAFLEMIEVSVG